MLWLIYLLFDFCGQMLYFSKYFKSLKFILLKGNILLLWTHIQIVFLEKDVQVVAKTVFLWRNVWENWEQCNLSYYVTALVLNKIIISFEIFIIKDQSSENTTAC